MIFCFKQKTAYEMRISDLSSDECSSDLKRSWTWQLAPGDRVPQSCPMTLKGAAGAATCDTTSGALPALSTVATRLPLPPAATLPKPRLAGTTMSGSVAAPQVPSTTTECP